MSASTAGVRADLRQDYGEVAVFVALDYTFLREKIGFLTGEGR